MYIWWGCTLLNMTTFWSGKYLASRPRPHLVSTNHISIIPFILSLMKEEGMESHAQQQSQHTSWPTGHSIAPRNHPTTPTSSYECEYTVSRTPPNKPWWKTQDRLQWRGRHDCGDQGRSDYRPSPFRHVEVNQSINHPPKDFSSESGGAERWGLLIYDDAKCRSTFSRPPCRKKKKKKRVGRIG